MNITTLSTLLDDLHEHALMVLRGYGRLADPAIPFASVSNGHDRFRPRFTYGVLSGTHIGASAHETLEGKTAETTMVSLFEQFCQEIGTTPLLAAPTHYALEFGMTMSEKPTFLLRIDGVIAHGTQNAVMKQKFFERLEATYTAMDAIAGVMADDFYKPMSLYFDNAISETIAGPHPEGAAMKLRGLLKPNHVLETTDLNLGVGEMSLLCDKERIADRVADYTRALLETQHGT